MLALSEMLDDYGTLCMYTSDTTLKEWRWLCKELSKADCRCACLEITGSKDSGHKTNFAIPIEQRPEAYLFAGLKSNRTVEDLTLIGNVLDTNMIYLLSNALKNNFTIKTLNLSDNSNIDFEGILQLTRCLPTTTMEHLDLSHTYIGNEGCEVLLNSLPNTLTSLDLSYCDITGESLSCLITFLKSNKTLTRLDLTSLRLYDGFAWREELTKIAVDYHSCCTLILCQPLKELLEKSSNTNELSLSNIEIRDNDVPDICVELIKKPTRWTSLIICINKLSAIGVHHLNKTLPNIGLIKLRVICDNLEEALVAIFFQTLGICDNLEVLELELGHFSSVAAEHLVRVLKKNESLTTLDLDGNKKITEDGLFSILKALNVNKKITKLLLSRNGLDEKRAAQLVKGGLGNLTELDLQYNELLQEGTRLLSQALERNNTIKELDLTGNSIGHEGTRYLALMLEKNVTITKLVLDNNRLGPKSAFALAKVIEKNNILREISLRENGLGDEGVKNLSRGFQQNTSIIKLDLFSNGIGGIGASHIAHMLIMNNKLEELDLSRNQIGNQGGVALGEALTKNCSVTKLNLKDNEIGDEGGVALGKGLTKNCTVTKLNLQDNEIGNESGRSLALGIEANNTLSDINLFQNNITDEGYEFIILALEKSHTLVKLHLGGFGGRIDDNIGVKLVSALAKVHTLRELELYYNGIGDRTLAHLSDSFLPNLTKLDLRGNNITVKSESFILAFLKNNRTLKTFNLYENPIQKGDETNAKNNEVWQRVLTAMKANGVSC